MNKSICFLLVVAPLYGNATIPKADRPSSQDHTLLRRYEGSFIVGYEQQAFAEFSLPLSKLEPVPNKKDNHNNQFLEPKQKKDLEGRVTRLVYLLPAGRSPLEVIRNYQQEIQSKGGRVLFECKAGDCGGEPFRGSSGGGGQMSLAMYLYPEERVKDPSFTNGNCAVTEDIVDQRFVSAHIPSASAYVTVQTYSLKDDLYCKAFNERTIAVVHIIEQKDREQKMVTVSAGEMVRQITSTGSIALYGIYFDFNKAEVKPESAATIAEIATLLKSNATLKLLVVGHTDNVGGYAFNLDLSQRRAAAVVQQLVSVHKADRNRLLPVGVSFSAPVASNKNEDGRARNRRVQLVEN